LLKFYLQCEDDSLKIKIYSGQKLRNECNRTFKENLENCISYITKSNSNKFVKKYKHNLHRLERHLAHIASLALEDVNSHRLIRLPADITFNSVEGP